MGSLTFTADSVQDLTGKVFIVTGGNSGLGYETALQLALHNGHVIIATHAQDPNAPMPADEIDGPGAVSKIKSEKPDAYVEYMECDLASFRGIDKFVKEFKAKGLPLYCLINNAGLQTPPDAQTEDGFEVMYGINFYGPLYLTHLLIPVLQQTASRSAGAGTPGNTRIVWTSSPAETLGQTDWNDLKGLKRGDTFEAYGTTKLWEIIVSMELNDRLKGTGVESFACHPGLARTDIFRKSDDDKIATFITDWAQWLSGQTAASGALAILYCATAPDLDGQGGTYYGAYYKGPIVFNVLNTSARTPGNSEVHDEAHRVKLYEALCHIMQQAASQAGVTVPEPIAKGSGLAHSQGVDAMTKVQQAERVAHATAAPAGVTV